MKLAIIILGLPGRGTLVRLRDLRMDTDAPTYVLQAAAAPIRLISFPTRAPLRLPLFAEEP